MSAPPGVTGVTRGHLAGMAKNNDQDAQRAAVRQAHREGKSASEAGVSTGASKQTDHATHGENRHEHGGSQGPSKT